MIPVIHHSLGHGAPCVTIQRRRVESRTGLCMGHVDERPHVTRVTAWGYDPQDVGGSVRPVGVELLFGPEVYHGDVLNRMGTLGAVVTYHPSEAAITETVERFLRLLATTPTTPQPIVRRDVPAEPNPTELCAICRVPTDVALGQHAGPKPLRCPTCESHERRAYEARKARRDASAGAP